MKTICRKALLYTILFPVPQSNTASCVSKKQTHVCHYKYRCTKSNFQEYLVFAV